MTMKSWQGQKLEEEAQTLAFKVMDRVSAVEMEYAKERGGPAGPVLFARRKFGWVTVLQLVQEMLDKLSETAQEEIVPSLTPLGNLQSTPPENVSYT